MRNSSVLPGGAASADEVGLDVVFKPRDVVDMVDGVVARNFGLVVVGGMSVVGFSVEFLVLSASSS